MKFRTWSSLESEKKAEAKLEFTDYVQLQLARETATLDWTYSSKTNGITLLNALNKECKWTHIKPIDTQLLLQWCLL